MRPRPETTPDETLYVSPSGLPIATTSPPTSTAPPSVAGTTGCGSVAGASVAMSCFGSADATLAADLVPSEKIRLTGLRSAITWFAVRTVPSSATITPVPSAPCAVRTTATDGPTRR